MKYNGLFANLEDVVFPCVGDADVAQSPLPRQKPTSSRPF